VRTGFVQSVLEKLLAEGVLLRSDAVVAVCAGQAERDVFTRLGFSDVTITNLDERLDAPEVAPFRWSRENAERLSFEDGSFDFSFVADGLHHCPSPHRALLEMYRVARKGIVAIESRDSLLMRTAVRLGLTPEYEVEAVVDNDFKWGGLNNSHIPNYIYRWTEADFRKTIKSFDPKGEHRFRFFYGLNLPYEQARMKKSPVKLAVVVATDRLLRGLTRVFEKQRNTLAMVALKPEVPHDLWPWLKKANGEIVFDREYAIRQFRGPS
jgi:SAM-dependent methyltransferase